ncbi:MAG: flagellar biosynthetic protein FliO [Planctomycetota bacterium]
MPRPANLFVILCLAAAPLGVSGQDAAPPEAEQRLAELAERYAGEGRADAARPVDIEDTPLGASASGESRPAGLTNDSAGIEEPTGGWLLSTLAALGVVIGLIFATRWAFAKLGGQTIARPTPAVEVLSRTAVAPKNQVLLLRVGQRVLVVGDSSSGLRTLADLDDPEEVAGLLQSVTAGSERSLSGGFNQLVARFNGEYDGEARTKVEGGDPDEFRLDRTRDSLSGLVSRLRTLAPGSDGGSA